MVLLRHFSYPAAAVAFLLDLIIACPFASHRMQNHLFLRFRGLQYAAKSAIYMLYALVSVIALLLHEFTVLLEMVVFFL
jgi:hypothetical protein